MATERAAPIDPAELDHVEWPMRGTELAALIGWVTGRLDRATFRRWLRSEGCPAGDVDELTAVIEHVRATERRMPERGGEDR